MTVAAETRSSEGVSERNYREQIRRVLLAGVGALVLAQEEIEDVLDRLAKKGEAAERDGRRMVLEAVARRKRDVDVGLVVLEKLLHAATVQALKRMHLMTKDDVASVSRSLDELERMVDRLEAASKE